MGSFELQDLRVSHEDLPAVEDIGQSDAAVVLPFLEDLKVVNEDNEVLGATLVVHLRGGIVSTRHDDCM